MHTTTVYLVKRSRKTKGGKTKRYYMLRWFSQTGRALHEAVGRCDKITKKDAEAKRREKELAFGKGEAVVDRPAGKGITLGEFQPLYLERRRQVERKPGRLKTTPKLRDSTIDVHAMTLRYLVEHFGADTRLSSISEYGAEQWAESLAAGKLIGAKVAKQRTRKSIGEQTVRKHLRNAKALFNWAIRAKYLMVNPFKDFQSDALPTDGNVEVPAAEIQKIIDHASTPPAWRALFALCRFAGLRLGEALSLPWAGTAVDRRGEKHRVGIDWDARLIRLVAQKTGMFRVVPMSPLVYEVLLSAYTAAAEGSDRIVAIKRTNPQWQALPILDAAGVKPWPKLFQALRSSCENDWKIRGIAEVTYCAWLGHDPKVSRDHYVNPTAAELVMITGKPTT